MRALLSLCALVVGTLALGSPATADEPLRAVPQARAYPRAFASYESLVAYALAVARAQNALDGRLDAVREEREHVAGLVAALRERDGGPGSIFETPEHAGERALLAELLARDGVLARADERILADGALTAPRSGWRLPVAGALTQPFGPTAVALEPGRVWGGIAYAHFHDGVDLAAPVGTPVVAPARGRVVFAGLMGDGAEVVVIVHDGGLVSLYAHLDAPRLPPPVSAGDEVAAGQRIGSVGLTGMTTGPHLHWVVWRAGALVDPLSIVRD